MPVLSKKFLVYTAMLAAAAMLLGTAWMGDDAFITLRVVDNFVNGYGLRYNAIERVQVFTHPLWMMILTPFYGITREPLVTTMLVSMVASLGALWLLATRITKDVEYGALLILLAMVSSTIYQFSTSGLETPLTFLLLALLVWQLHRREFMWIPAGVIIGLLLLNRLDLAVLVGPAAAYIFYRARGRRIMVALAVALPTTVWMAFSVIYYGAPFPNTAYAKLGTGYSEGDLIVRGLYYTRDFVLNDPLLALVICKAVFDALRSRSMIAATLGAGIILYMVYTLAIGGDFMSGRFFAPPGFLALCLLATEPVPQFLARQARVVAMVALLALAALLAARVTDMPSTDAPEWGIAYERSYYYLYDGIYPAFVKRMEAEPAPVHAWKEKGLELRATGQSVREKIAAHKDTTGAPVNFSGPVICVSSFSYRAGVGMLGYYAGPDVHILDPLALTDPFLARLPAIPGSRVGHYARRVPPGYIESVIGNAYPTTNIAALRPLLNDVVLATRAPIFSEGRWSAIWRLTSGYYKWIYGENVDRLALPANSTRDRYARNDARRP